MNYPLLMALLVVVSLTISLGWLVSFRSGGKFMQCTLLRTLPLVCTACLPACIFTEFRVLQIDCLEPEQRQWGILVGIVIPLMLLLILFLSCRHLSLRVAIPRPPDT